MEHGQDAQHAATVGQQAFDMPDHLGAVGGQVGMGQHGPLGHAGGPAGVLQHRDIVGRLVDRVGRGRGGQQVAQPQMQRRVGDGRVLGPLEQGEAEPHQAGQHAPHLAQDDRVDPAARGHGFHLVVDHRDIGHGDHPGAGIADLMFQLALGIERVEVDHDRPDAQRGEVQHDESGAVGQAQPEAVPGTQAPVLQSPRGALHHVGQIAIGPGPPIEVDREAPGMGARRPVEQFGDQAGAGHLPGYWPGCWPGSGIGGSGLLEQHSGISSGVVRPGLRARRAERADRVPP